MVEVGVIVGVLVGVPVGVLVGVGVAVPVLVGVGVGVGVLVGVWVGTVVGVAVGAPATVTQAENSEVLPEGSVAVAVTNTSPDGRVNGGSGPKLPFGVPLPAQTPVVTL